MKKLNLGAEAKGPLNCQFTLSVSSGDDGATKAEKKTSSLPLCQRHESLQKALSAERDCFRLLEREIISFNSFLRVCYKFKWKATGVELVRWKIALNHVHCIWWQFSLRVRVTRKGRFNEVVQSRRAMIWLRVCFLGFSWLIEQNVDSFFVRTERD